MTLLNQLLSDADLLSLVRRMELEPKLLRRHLEEQIIELVPLEEALLEKAEPIVSMAARRKSFFKKRAGRVLTLTCIYVDLRRYDALLTNVLLRV